MTALPHSDTATPRPRLILPGWSWNWLGVLPFALFALLFLAQLPTLRRLPFFLSWWAFAFPLAALAVATTIMAGLTGSAVLEVAAWAVLTLGTALVALLGVRTAGAVLRGRICVPE